LRSLLDDRFGPFDFDPAPHPLPGGYDGLDPAVRWGNRNFLNPPFVNLDQWVIKAVQELRDHGHETLLLCPFRPHMKWWLTHLSGKFAILPVIGYVRFKGYLDELPTSLACVWISSEPVSAELRTMQHAVFRPLEMARRANAGRLSHDQACARFPGAIVDNTDRVLLTGPVRPFEGVVSPPSKKPKTTT